MAPARRYLEPCLRALQPFLHADLSIPCLAGSLASPCVHVIVMTCMRGGLHWHNRMTDFRLPARQQYAHFKRKPFWEGRQRVILIGVGAAGTLFYITHLQEVPYTHRKHAIFVSPQTEIALGLQTFQQVLHFAKTLALFFPALGHLLIFLQALARLGTASSTHKPWSSM